MKLGVDLGNRLTEIQNFQQHFPVCSKGDYKAAQCMIPVLESLQGENFLSQAATKGRQLKYSMKMSPIHKDSNEV